MSNPIELALERAKACRERLQRDADHYARCADISRNADAALTFSGFALTRVEELEAIRTIMAALVEARGALERANEALEPSAGTKAAYLGEFKMRVAQLDEDDEEVWSDILVPWDTIKEIMAAIRARTALEGIPKEGLTASGAVSAATSQHPENPDSPAPSGPQAQHSDGRGG